ncbi:hypothetical protein QUF74_13840 [Candidatus Halobeggiatoa sp. HSG11]|nr:hypothetical protein [Candidatus Halobeggiatoa sp. HSG11]
MLKQKILLTILIVFFVSCVQTPKMEIPLTETPLEFNEAITKLANHLYTQLQNKGIDDQVTLIYIPFVHTDSGQVLQVSLDIRNLFFKEVKKFKNFKLAKSSRANNAKADYIIDGIIEYEYWQSNQSRNDFNVKKSYHISAMIYDAKTYKKIADEDIWISDKKLNTVATPSSKDNPTYVKGKNLQALIKAIKETPRGEIISSIYSNFLETKSMLVEAETFYDNGEYQKARHLYETIAQRPDGKLVATYGGQYATYIQLDMEKEAKEAYGKMVKVGFENDSLPVKIIFGSSSTEFINDQDTRRQYTLLLEKSGLYFKHNRNRCAYILGHASKSAPSKKFNCNLSRKRAEAIRDKIIDIYPRLYKKLRSIGKGAEECKVCSIPDSDDNVIDRRVEFKVVACDSDIWRFRQEKECSVE